MPRPDDVGVGTAVLILNEQGQVLLLERDGAHWAGFWSVPGGWVDRPDETTEKAVEREAIEEVGITLLNIEKFTWTTEDNPEIGCRTVTLYHLCRSGNWSGHPRVREPAKCKQIRWCDLDNLPSPLFPGLEAVLATLPRSKKVKHPILVGGYPRDPDEVEVLQK